MLCGCCNKPLNLVADVEPYFVFPDDIAKMPAVARKQRCDTSSDICSIDWDNSHSFGRPFIRCVIPIEVHDRPERSFKWGVWCELARRDDLFRIMDLWKSEEQVEEPAFDVLLANELNGPLGASMSIGSTSVRTALSQPPAPSLGAPGLLRLTGPKTRPYFYFDESVDHLIASAQRDGVLIKETFAWTRMFHRMVAS